MQSLMSLITILATVAIVHAQTNGVNLVTAPLEKYIYKYTTSSPIAKTYPAVTFSDGIYVRDTFSNTPIACNGDWQKADVQIYKKGTCYNIPPATAVTGVTAQANSICNFAYTVTNLQTSFVSSTPSFVADTTPGNTGNYAYVNNPAAGCSYQMILDVANCANILYLPYYGQGCQTRVGSLQYQTTLISGVQYITTVDAKGVPSTSFNPNIYIWLGFPYTSTFTTPSTTTLVNGIPTSQQLAAQLAIFTTSYTSTGAFGTTCPQVANGYTVNSSPCTTTGCTTCTVTTPSASISVGTVVAQVPVYASTNLINCASTNTANINKLNAVPLTTTCPTGYTVTGAGTVASPYLCTSTTMTPTTIAPTFSAPSSTSTLYQCGATMNIEPAPTGSASECQNGIAGCSCVNGISSRCMYSLDMLTGGSYYNLLVMSSWDNNLGLGCTGNMTEAQVVATGTCLSANHLTTTNPHTIKINGDVLTRPYVKATVATGGQQYNLNFYHTEINCLADSNAVETYVGQMGTCLTEDDHPSDDAIAKGGSTSKYNNIFYGPNNVVGMTNRILVNYYPASYNGHCGDDDDNYCTITSGGIAGIVIAVVFVVFLLLVILFMCIRYCGKAPTAGAAPTVTTQSKGGEGNPLLSGSV